MVTLVRGNIIESPAQVIVNPINCVGVMGKGLALQFKKAFPQFYQDYVERCRLDKVTLGVPYLWESEDAQIIGFPTKRHWRDKSSLNSIEQGLTYLANNYDQLGITTLALPALGCGNGGLQWENVRDLIIRYLGEIPDLEVFVYEPAAKADEQSYDNSYDSEAPKTIAARSVNLEAG